MPLESLLECTEHLASGKGRLVHMHGPRGVPRSTGSPSRPNCLALARTACVGRSPKPQVHQSPFPQGSKTGTRDALMPPICPLVHVGSIQSVSVSPVRKSEGKDDNLMSHYTLGIERQDEHHVFWLLFSFYPASVRRNGQAFFLGGGNVDETGG